MEVHYSAVCAPGKVRSCNQDNLYVNGRFRSEYLKSDVFICDDISIPPVLFAVCDGMGGEEYGELASYIAVSGLGDIDLQCFAHSAANHLLEINEELCLLAIEKGCRRIGTTFAGLCITNETVTATNIGDSRVYRIRSGDIHQLSCDHTEAHAMAKMGIISIDEARIHPKRHQLTQHLGIHNSEIIIEPYFNTLDDLKPGDIMLLCSDGLTDMLRDEQIVELIKNTKETHDTALALYNAAMSAGGKDNITVIVLSFAN